MTSVLYPPPMSTYEWVLWDLYIGGGVQDTMKYGRYEALHPTLQEVELWQYCTSKLKWTTIEASAGELVNTEVQETERQGEISIDIVQDLSSLPFALNDGNVSEEQDYVTVGNSDDGTESIITVDYTGIEWDTDSVTT